MNEEIKKEYEKLKATVKYHNDRYYNQDDPEISDYEYDQLSHKLRDMEAQAKGLVASMQAAVSSNMQGFAVNAASSATLRASSSIGTTVYNDNHVEQENTYNVPVATPSETARAQREAVRNLVGGVK